MDLLDVAVREAKSYRYHLVYGAQAIAYGIQQALSAVFSLGITGYVVSAREGNPAVIDEKPVFLLQELMYPAAETFFFIAVPEYLHAEIVRALRVRGYEHYQCVDDGFGYALMRRYFPASEHVMAVGEPSPDAKWLLPTQLEVYVACSAADRRLTGELPVQPYFHTVWAGAAFGRSSVDGWQDDVGDNISRENHDYAELTVTYWAWKNRHVPYKGIAHYRRYLCLSVHQEQLLLEGKIDVFLPFPFICWPDASAQYLRYNRPEAIAAMLKAIGEQAPALAARTKEILEGQYLYNYNMLIARETVFDAYCAWIFPILERVRELCRGLWGSEEPDRLCGHLGEVLTSLYFMLHADELTILHVRKQWII